MSTHFRKSFCQYSYIFRAGELVCYNMNKFNDCDQMWVTIPGGKFVV